MKNRKTVNEVFPLWKSSEGIFNLLNVYPVPWRGNPNVNPSMLDFDYHGNHSGNKLVSPLVENLANSGTGGIGSLIASIVWTKYGKQFEKLWATLNFEYDPIANVDGIEEETIHNTETGSGENTASGTSNSVSSASGSDTEHVKRNGYNTTQATDTDNTSATTQSNGNNTTTNNTHSDTSTTSEGTTTRTLRRKGNIGVTMSQQLINAERDLWYWNYFEQVYSMIDEILTLKVW